MMILDNGAEQRLSNLGITFPSPPTPFGAYVEAVKIGNLLFLSGMARWMMAPFLGDEGSQV